MNESIYSCILAVHGLINVILIIMKCNNLDGNNFEFCIIVATIRFMQCLLTLVCAYIRASQIEWPIVTSVYVVSSQTKYVALSMVYE